MLGGGTRYIHEISTEMTEAMGSAQSATWNKILARKLGAYFGCRGEPAADWHRRKLQFWQRLETSSPPPNGQSTTRSLPASARVSPTQQVYMIIRHINYIDPEVVVICVRCGFTKHP